MAKCYSLQVIEDRYEVPDGNFLINFYLYRWVASNVFCDAYKSWEFSKETRLSQQIGNEHVATCMLPSEFQPKCSWKY